MELLNRQNRAQPRAERKRHCWPSRIVRLAGLTMVGLTTRSPVFLWHEAKDAGILDPI
jgi:hypothetical protein